MSEQEIVERFKAQYGDPPNSCYTLKVRQSQKGNWIVERWYQRSSWVDGNMEQRVIYDQHGDFVKSE